MALSEYVENPRAVLPKDPDAILSYGFNFTDWLDSDTILSAAWTVYPAVGTLVVEGTNNDDNVAVIKLSGGAVGERYDLTCHITTTTNSEEDDRTFRIEIKER